MAAYPQYLNDLNTLDLSSTDTITLAVVTKKYKSMSLLLHPDKNPQNVQKHTDLFQELNSSYRRLIDHIHKNIDKTQIDGEELNLYEYYNLHNIVKENRTSVTVNIENERENQWETTMTSLFGPATINKDKTGKIWQVQNYQDSNQKVTITLYIRPKSDNQSKLHIQSGASWDKVFSTLELPVIYQKVLLEVPNNEAIATEIQIEHPQPLEEIVDLPTSETVPSASNSPPSPTGSTSSSASEILEGAKNKLEKLSSSMMVLVQPPTSAPPSSSTAIATYFEDSQEPFLKDVTIMSDSEAETTDENIEFQCEKCNTTTKTNCELSAHVQSTHNLESKNQSTKFPCDECDLNFNTTRQLIDHVTSTHSEENIGFQCEECDTVTNTITEMSTHVISTHHYYHCDQCNMQCTTTKELIAHFVTRHQENLSTCNTCGLVTANTDVLQKHILTSHASQLPPEPTSVNTEETLNALKKEIQEGVKEQLKTHLEKITCLLETRQQNVNHKNTKAENNESPIENSYRPTLETMFKNKSISVAIDIPEDVIEENSEPNTDYPSPNTDTDYPSPNTDAVNAGDTSDVNKSLQDQGKEENKTARMKGLWIADSIGSFINKEALEESTNSDITFENAYTAARDKKAHSPDENFTDVTNRALANEHFDWIGLQGGACDISNLDLSENVEVLKQQAFISASNMFSLSLKIVNANPTTNVFLMKRTPRVDTNHEDPNGLKSQLSEYADSIYQQLWIEHGCSPQIIIGDHFIFNCRGENKDKLFGQPNTRNYDGVHFRTNFGKQQYTRSVLLTFKRCWPERIKVPKMQKLLNQPPHPTPSSSPSPSPTSSSPFPALVSTQLPDTSRPPPQRRGYVTEGTYKKNPFAWSKVAGQKHRRFVPQPQQIPLQNQYQALADY